MIVDLRVGENCGRVAVITVSLADLLSTLSLTIGALIKRTNIQGVVCISGRFLLE